MNDRYPLDAAIRQRLRTLKIKQKELAAKVGRSPGWVSKYLSGTGHATVDDVIRLLGVALGVEGLSDQERRLLKAWRRIPVDSQPDVLKWIENWARRELRAARKRG